MKIPSQITKKKIYVGDLIVEGNKTYDYDEITGYVDVSENASLSLPAVTTIGGSVDVSANASLNAPKLKDKEAGYSICEKTLTKDLAKKGLILQDGILAKIVSSRGNVSRIKIIGQSAISYLVKQDGHSAHGKTLAEARADLLVKIGKRDTSQYKKWTLETKVSLEEMIVAYRSITGACGAGVTHFLSTKNYKGKLSVAFVIKETEGRYGHETFKGFFEGKTK